MNRRSGGSSVFEPIDRLLEPDDVVVADDRFGDARCQFVGRVRQLCAEREEVALDLNQLRVQRRIEL